MENLVTGKPCAGECDKPIYGLSYTCQKCGVPYCFTCSYYAKWKCPKCGAQLT